MTSEALSKLQELLISSLLHLQVRPDKVFVVSKD